MKHEITIKNLYTYQMQNIMNILNDNDMNFKIKYVAEPNISSGVTDISKGVIFIFDSPEDAVTAKMKYF